MKRTTLAFAAILSLGAASLGSTGAATAKDLTVASNPGAASPAASIQLAAGYRYYRIVPRRYVRIQLRRRGYYRIHHIRLIRTHVRRHHGGYRYRPRVRAIYVAYAYKHGRKFRIYANAYTGRPFRRVRVW